MPIPKIAQVLYFMKSLGTRTSKKMLPGKMHAALFQWWYLKLHHTSAIFLKRTRCRDLKKDDPRQNTAHNQCYIPMILSNQLSTRSMLYISLMQKFFFWISGLIFGYVFWLVKTRLHEFFQIYRPINTSGPPI